MPADLRRAAGVVPVAAFLGALFVAGATAGVTQDDGTETPADETDVTPDITVETVETPTEGEAIRAGPARPIRWSLDRSFSTDRTGRVYGNRVGAGRISPSRPNGTTCQ